MRNEAYVLQNGKIVEEVDALRLFIDGQSDSGLLTRRAAVWKFLPRRSGVDIFVTSSGLQQEMKGTVHATRAQFGFANTAPPESWVGPPPKSRHIQILEPLGVEEGQFQKVMAVSFPGFALKSTPVQIESTKRHIPIDAPQPHEEVTFGLTIFCGDVTEVSTTNPNQMFVGMLKVAGNRKGLISVTRHRYPDVEPIKANIQRNLSLIPPVNKPMPTDELGAVLWMQRTDVDPIHMIELNNVVYKTQSDDDASKSALE